MKNIFFLLLTIPAIAVGQISMQVVKLAGGFGFLEGPACDQKGNVYFTDIPNNRIHIWTVDQNLDTFRNNTGGANGLFLDGDENVYACEGINRQLTMTDKKGNVSVVCSLYHGKKINQPNDLWIDPKGGIYFSDPFYTGNPKIIEQDGKHVYYLSADHKSVIRVINDYEMPNGLVGTPDGKTIYVTDISGEKTWKYKINADGSLSGKTLLANVGSDGMTLDQDGNVYLTNFKTSSVDIYSQAGKLLDVITFPEVPANVCFGGTDHNILFVTARTSLYCIKMKTTGFGKNMQEYGK